MGSTGGQILGDTVSEFHESRPGRTGIGSRHGVQLVPLQRREVEDRSGGPQHLARPQCIERSGERMAGRDDHAVGLHRKGDFVTPRAHRDGKNHEVAAEMDVDEVEPGPIPVEPPLQAGRADTCEPCSRNEGPGGGEELYGNTVHTVRRHPEAAGAGGDGHLVTAIDQRRTLVECDPSRSSVCAVGTEKGDHVEDTHESSRCDERAWSAHE